MVRSRDEVVMVTPRDEVVMVTPREEVVIVTPRVRRCDEHDACERSGYVRELPEPGDDTERPGGPPLQGTTPSHIK